MGVRFATNPHNKVPQCPIDPTHTVVLRTSDNGRKKHLCEVCNVQTCHYDCGHASAMNPQCRPQKASR